jgi:hypothetical protein
VSKHLNETPRGAISRREIFTGHQRASYGHVVGEVRVVLPLQRECSRRTFTPTEELPPSFQAVTRRHQRGLAVRKS